MSIRLSLVAVALLAAVPGAAQFQSEGYKFLQAVKQSKNDEVISALARPGSTVVNTKDVTTGEAALHITTRRGDRAYTSFLLQKGADPNIRDARNNTPMMIAVEAGQNDLIPLLLLGKANPNLANQSGETPLIRAVQRRDIALVRTLLAAKADPDQRDVMAGLSARDYASRDTRAAPIAKLFAETPRLAKPAVAGPKF